MEPIGVKSDPDGGGGGDLALLESVAEEEHSSPDFKKEEEKHEDTILSDHPEGTDRWIFLWRNCNLFVFCRRADYFGRIGGSSDFRLQSETRAAFEAWNPGGNQ